MALWLEKAQECPQCGTRYDDFDPRKGGHIHAYYAKTFVCEGCRIGEDAYSAAVDNAREVGRESRGLKVRLVPNPNRT
jgi:hypothetical protein